MAPALLAAESAGSLTAVAPEFHKLFDPGARIEKVTEGFQFTEGPVWSPKQFLLFSDIYGDRSTSGVRIKARRFFATKRDFRTGSPSTGKVAC